MLRPDTVPDDVDRIPPLDQGEPGVPGPQYPFGHYRPPSAGLLAVESLSDDCPDVDPPDEEGFSINL
ncbi:hypothetical protein ABZV31_07180 [Streptomyces sp. NPDC005202]|uniref:hypothetical protein n=1 Tax=Streptomyces sp. NPDC005202 TaxID=3157021 RepID=UPI0033A899CF